MDQSLPVNPPYPKISYEALAALTSSAINSLDRADHRDHVDEHHPSDALAGYIARHYSVDLNDAYVTGIGEGVEVGLQFAVAILTHGLDYEKIREDGRRAVDGILWLSPDWEVGGRVAG